MVMTSKIGLLKRRWVLGGVGFALLAGGCATVGPGVTSAELAQARQWLEVKAVRFKHAQALRVNEALLRSLIVLQPTTQSAPAPEAVEHGESQ